MVFSLIYKMITIAFSIKLTNGKWMTRNENDKFDMLLQ